MRSERAQVDAHLVAMAHGWEHRRVDAHLAAMVRGLRGAMAHGLREEREHLLEEKQEIHLVQAYYRSKHTG